MISREDKLKMFINEIGDIKDADLKALATELIANADDYLAVFFKSLKDAKVPYANIFSFIR